MQKKSEGHNKEAEYFRLDKRVRQRDSLGPCISIVLFEDIYKICKRRTPERLYFNKKIEDMNSPCKVSPLI